MGPHDRAGPLAEPMTGVLGYDGYLARGSAGV